MPALIAAQGENAAMEKIFGEMAEKPSRPVVRPIR
jgi:hypothetical protein